MDVPQRLGLLTPVMGDGLTDLEDSKEPEDSVSRLLRLLELR